MAQSISDALLDALADDLIANCDKMILCSQEPTNLTEAETTYALADVAMAGGDFTKAAGDVAGRKVTIAEKLDVDVDANGDGTHVALVQSGVSLMFVNTTTTTKTVSAGGKVNLETWKIESSLQ